MSTEPECSRMPEALRGLYADTEHLGFTMVSDPKTGGLLSVLAASKPGGRLLEIGTGTGVGTAWLLAGMDPHSHLDSIDTDPRVQAVARRHLGEDRRVTFHLADGAEFLTGLPRGQVDLVYADAWPGKFTHLDEALALVRIGGLYVIDDLLPQPNWPEGHASKVDALIADLERHAEFAHVKMSWASGLMILVRTSQT